MAKRTAPPLATLWRLAWNEERLSCAVYRVGASLQLRVESGSVTILAQPFEFRPRSVARMQSLRRSLKRRGWQEAPAEDA